MAVYTHITDAALCAYLAQYDLPPVTRFEGIAQGVENTNYRLYVGNQRYILTIFESRVDPLDLPFFFSFMNHLAEHGIQSPKVIAGRDGGLVYPLADKPAALISYLDGADIKQGDITTDHCGEIGNVLGRMHQAALSFPQSRSNTLSLQEWQHIAAQTQAGADTVEPGLAKLIADELVFLKANWPHSAAFPCAVVHADLFPDNVFFQNNKVSGVIDFYFSCTDFLSYDLALVINAWCFDLDHRFSDARWSALQKTYDATRGRSGAERDALSILCRGAALRILLTRLYAWLNHPVGAFVQPKDPKEYSAKLRWHQNEKIGR